MTLASEPDDREEPSRAAISPADTCEARGPLCYFQIHFVLR